LTAVAGETDWKVIAIDVSDPLANDLNGMYPAAVPDVQALVQCVGARCLCGSINTFVYFLFIPELIYNYSDCRSVRLTAD